MKSMRKINECAITYQFCEERLIFIDNKRLFKESFIIYADILKSIDV